MSIPYLTSIVIFLPLVGAVAIVAHGKQTAAEAIAGGGPDDG